jgi:cytochrome b subunit of formate dehydrogenase
MIRQGTFATGLLGFTLVMLTGLGLGNQWEKTLLSATMVALAFGLMGRWWMALWLRSMMEAHSEQTELEAIAAQNTAASKTELKSENQKKPSDSN